MAFFRRFRRPSVRLLVLLAWAVNAEASAALEYRVVYKGVFSAGAEMPIADLRFDSRELPGTPGMLETRIEASSKAYPVVETVFPIRYRIRSWTTAAEQARLLGFETYENTRKVRNRLYLRDDTASGVRRFDLTAGAGRREIAQLESGFSPVGAAAGQRLFDRLGLLQAVRHRNLRDQASFSFDVTNGRELLVYRVKVEAAQVLKLDGVAIPAWKLRFDGLETGPNGRRKPAHHPLYLWLSQSPGHIPLRVDSRHGVGLFRIELKNRSALDQLARTGP